MLHTTTSLPTISEPRGRAYSLLLATRLIAVSRFIRCCSLPLAMFLSHLCQETTKTCPLASGEQVATHLTSAYVLAYMGRLEH
jgi:hypothetical protein